MNYETAMDNIFAYGTIANGYCGDTAKVGFAFDPHSKKIWCVASCGCFTWCEQKTPDPFDTVAESTHVFQLRRVQ